MKCHTEKRSEEWQKNATYYLNVPLVVIIGIFVNGETALSSMEMWFPFPAIPGSKLLIKVFFCKMKCNSIN